MLRRCRHLGRFQPFGDLRRAEAVHTPSKDLAHGLCRSFINDPPVLALRVFQIPKGRIGGQRCAVSRTFVKERNIYANALLSGADTSTLLGTQAVDVDDDIKTLVEFENGATGTLWSSRFCLGHEDSLDIEIYGSKGSARFSRERPNELEFYSSNDPSDERGFHRIKMGPEHPNGELWPMADLGIGYVEQKCVEYRDFFRAVALGDPSLVSCSFYDGYKVCQFIDAAKQSSREGGWVVLENI